MEHAQIVSMAHFSFGKKFLIKFLNEYLCKVNQFYQSMSTINESGIAVSFSNNPLSCLLACPMDKYFCKIHREKSYVILITAAKAEKISSTDNLDYSRCIHLCK